MNIIDILDNNENNKNFCNLKKDFKLTPQSIIPFIGAGMSCPIFPSWSQFFYNALDQVRLSPIDEEKIKNMIDNNLYEEAASELAQSLGKGRFIDVIKDEFSSSKITEEFLKKMPVGLLPNIFKNNVILTTNFDHVLETCYRRASNTFTNTFTYYDNSDILLSEALQGRGHHLFKIHGDYSITDKIVFTKEQYDKCYGKKLNSGFVKNLSAIVKSKILLFLGCSLQTDRTMDLLKKIALSSHGTHYAIIESKNDESFYERLTYLSNLNIRCICFPENKYDYIEIILKELSKSSDNIKNCDHEEIIDLSEEKKLLYKKIKSDLTEYNNLLYNLNKIHGCIVSDDDIWVKEIQKVLKWTFIKPNLFINENQYAITLYKYKNSIYCIPTNIKSIYSSDIPVVLCEIWISCKNKCLL